MSEQYRYRLKYRRPEKDDGTESLNQLREQMRVMKLRAPKRPKMNGEYINPRVPSDISRLTDERLQQLHSEFAAMAQYVMFQVALRAVECSISRRADRITRARVRLEKSGTNDDKAAKTEVDARTKNVSQLLLVAEAAERMTQSLLDGYIIGRDLCSRELTRRMALNNGR